MEFKGTKGIWVTDDNYEGFILTDSGAYKPNAMLQSCTTKEERKANAKLIAQAPILLKTLTVLVEQNMLSYEGDKLALEAINKALK